jgi:hypothetical protein
MSAKKAADSDYKASELLPRMADLRQAARQIFSKSDQGPLFRFGLDVHDVANLERLPSIRRARDFHLYAFDGKRYLDLYRGEAFNLLGHSVRGFQLSIKNRLSQALWQGLPHPLYKQVKRTLERCFPAHTALICPDRHRILGLLELLGIKVERPLLPLASDLGSDVPPHELTYWFPFTASPAPISVAVIPSLGIQGPYVLLVESRIYAHHLKSFGTHEHEVFSILDYIGHQVPVYALAGLVTALSALEGLGAFAGMGTNPAPGSSVTLGAINHPRTRGLQEQLGIWREPVWQTIDTGHWKRTGPYLRHPFKPADYAQVFASALQAGILLHPRSSGINCLPGVLSPGEKAALEKLFAWSPTGGT